MPYLLLLCLGWVILIGFLRQARNYPALILTFLVGVYELPSLILFYARIEVPAIEAAQRILESTVSPQTASSHVITLIVFFVSFALVSAITYQRDNQSLSAAIEENIFYGPPQPRLARALRIFTACLAFVILVFGTLSVLREEGLRRLGDYVGDDYKGLRVFSYGIGLLPALTCLAVAQFIRGKTTQAALLLVSALPLLYEIFLTSRRQYFLPVLFVILMWRLYGSSKRLSSLTLVALVAIVLLAFGLQYSLRESVIGEDAAISRSVLEGSLAPQLGEFVAIGTTSLSSYPLVEQRGFTYGSQFTVAALNAIPFAKLGDLMFPKAAQQFTDITDNVAPFGGLSMIAECFLSFGMVGVSILGLVMAALASKFHRKLVDFYSRRKFSAKNILVVSIGCALLGKYRSGVSDAFLTFTSLSILFAAVYFIAVLLNAVLFGPRGRPLLSRGEA